MSVVEGCLLVWGDEIGRLGLTRRIIVSPFAIIIFFSSRPGPGGVEVRVSGSFTNGLFG